MGEHYHQENNTNADEKKLIYHCNHPVIKKNPKTTQSKGFLHTY